MTFWTLIRRSLAHHWRAHLGVGLGAAVASAILVGALAVGDCVQHTLRTMALARLGKTELALAPPNRFFREALGEEIAQTLKAPAVPVVLLAGTARIPNTTRFAANVQVIGVDARFWQLADDPAAGAALDAEGVVINQRLAERLSVRVGDEVLLQVEKPTALPRDALLAAAKDPAVKMNLTVRAVATDGQLGRFSLRAGQVPPFNAFVSLGTVQRRAGLALPAPRVNTVLLGGATTVEQAGAALASHWTLADVDLELRELSGQQCLELRSGRVFLDAPVVEAVRGLSPQAQGVLTYLANAMQKPGGGEQAPYSMIAGIGLLDPGVEAGAAAPTALSDSAALLSRLAGLKDDEVLVSPWLQRDLSLSENDPIQISYFVAGAGSALAEATATLGVCVAADVPMSLPENVPVRGWGGDRELLPPFPDLPKGDRLGEWEPGFPLKYRIRSQDDDYWRDRRGTPKAFVKLSTAQRLWANRFGDLTAIRYPSGAVTAAQVEARLRERLDLKSLGLSFQPVRQQALATSGQATDFGQLFLGLSFFIIVAALLLMGLLFAFSVEQRAAEVGTLLAVGFTPGKVRRLLLAEGLMLALAGALAGTLGGLGYARGILWLLSSPWWRGAVGTADLRFAVRPATLAIGAGAAGVVAGLTIAWRVWRQARQPARVLLSGDPELRATSAPARRGRVRGGLVASGACAAAALVLGGTMVGARGEAQAGAFFGAGALLLLSTLALAYASLARTAGGAKPQAAAEGAGRLTVGGMGVRGAGRRRGRSLATVGLLSCGCFLVVAVGAHRRDASAGAEERGSGTGGFALYAQATLPVVYDMNSADGRQQLGLSDKELDGVSVVPLRVREGDDASCLNLNRVAAPRLLGVSPKALGARGAFTFTQTDPGSWSHSPWELLDAADAPAAVPAIGDAATVTWGLGKSVGDVIAYTDERGRPFNVRIVGVVSNSILQGSLVVAEDELLKRYPSQSGYRAFLIDAPPGRAKAAAGHLMDRLEAYGLEAMPAAQRLALFNAVENTYLTIFQALGALGLLLGTVGLGVVVLRNLLERRGELALLRAVGFSLRQVRWLVLSEHWLLVGMGLASGVVAAGLAVLPALLSPGAKVPYLAIVLTIAAIAGSALLWTFLAVAAAVRGSLVAALRAE